MVDHQVLGAQRPERRAILPEGGHVRPEVDDEPTRRRILRDGNAVRCLRTLGQSSEVTPQLGGIAPGHAKPAAPPGVDEEVGAIVPDAGVGSPQAASSEEAGPEHVRKPELLGEAGAKSRPDVPPDLDPGRVGNAVFRLQLGRDSQHAGPTWTGEGAHPDLRSQ